MTELNYNALDYSCALLTLAITWLAAWGLGQLFASALYTVWPRPAEKVGDSAEFKSSLLLAAVGLNLLGLCAVLLNALSLGSSFCRTSLIAALAVAGLCLVAKQLRGSYYRARSDLTSSRATKRPTPPLKLVDWVALTALGIITLGQAFTLPSGWDELVYHQTLPQRWHAQGGMPVFHDIPYSGFPSMVESIYWLQAPLSSPLAGSLLSWSVWMVGLMILQLLLQGIASNRLSQLLVLAFGTTDTALMVSGNGYVESFALLNIAGLLYLLRFPHFVSDDGRSAAANLLLIANLAAGSVAVKLTGLPVLAVPMLYIAVQNLGQRNWVKRSLPVFLLLSCAYAVFLLPFFARPWLAVGNPFYPYFETWFTNDPARLETSRYHHALGSDMFGVRGLVGDTMAPLLLSCNRDLFDGSFGLQSLLWFGIPLGIYAVKRQLAFNSTLGFALVAVILFAFWSATAQQARFAIPAVVSMLACCAESWRDLSTRSQRVLAVLMVALSISSAPWPLSGYYVGGWQTCLGALPQATFLREGVGDDYMNLIDAIRQRTDDDDKILLLFEHRSFYLSGQAECTIGTPLFQSENFAPAQDYDTVEEVIGHLRAKKITHVVLSVVHAGPDFSPDSSEQLKPFLEAFATAATQHLTLIWEEGRYKVFELK